MSDDKEVCCMTVDESDAMQSKSNEAMGSDLDGDKVDAIITTVEKILQLLLDIDKGYKQGIEFNHDFLYKILRPTFVQAENLLPDLRDLCDDLQMHEDKREHKLSQLIAKLESEGIEPLLPLIESLQRGDK